MRLKETQGREAEAEDVGAASRFFSYCFVTFNGEREYLWKLFRNFAAEGCETAYARQLKQLCFLDLMVPMYIEARYPEQKDAAARMLSNEACQHIINTTKELTQWIEERLPETKPSTSSDSTSES